MDIYDGTELCEIDCLYYICSVNYLEKIMQRQWSVNIPKL